MRMPRRTFYALTVTILASMVVGLLEIIYDLVCDGDPVARLFPAGWFDA
jgi:hypothetical protein